MEDLDPLEELATKEDRMIGLLIGGLIVGVLWLIGWIRAVRNEPINQRLREYGTRRSSND